MGDGKASKIIIPTDAVNAVTSNVLFSESTGLGDVTKSAPEKKTAPKREPRKPHPRLKKALHVLLMTLLAVILVALFYLAVILGQPEEPENAIDIDQTQPLLTASPALNIQSERQVAALAEALVGCAKGAQSAVIVTLGTGVGGGVVLDGKMLTGYTGAASELGHMVIRAGGEECTCGRRGCFEAYASATALIRETKRAMAAHPESRMHAAAEENGAVDGRTAFIAAQRGDAAAQAVVDRYLDDLACGVANIVNIFFPEVIALSGGVANQGDALLVPLRERVRALSYGSRYAVRHTRIELCTLGYRAGVIGAALLAKQS